MSFWKNLFNRKSGRTAYSTEPVLSSLQLIQSLGGGTFVKSKSLLVLLFETKQSDDDLRYVFRQCSQELASARSELGFIDSPFFFAFPEWNNDPREIYEIPEARALAKRLNEFGLMALLNKLCAVNEPKLLHLAGQAYLYCMLTGKHEFSVDSDRQDLLQMSLTATLALSDFVGQ